jgi:hypothetical protein
MYYYSPTLWILLGLLSLMLTTSARALPGREPEAFTGIPAFEVTVMDLSVATAQKALEKTVRELLRQAGLPVITDGSWTAPVLRLSILPVCMIASDTTCTTADLNHLQLNVYFKQHAITDYGYSGHVTTWEVTVGTMRGDKASMIRKALDLFIQDWKHGQLRSRNIAK